MLECRMNASRFFRVSGFLAVLFLLAACDTAEERAEKHFQSGIELLEAGDIRRALVEFVAWP